MQRKNGIYSVESQTFFTYYHHIVQFVWDIESVQVTLTDINVGQS